MTEELQPCKPTKPACMLDPTKPLWLPEGSVRAIFTGGALFTASLLLLFQIQVPEWFVGLIVMVVQNYFNARGNEGKTKG